MATTPFLDVIDNGFTTAPLNSLNNVTNPITLTNVNTSRFNRQIVNGLEITIWDNITYSDPALDPAMEKAIITAVTVGASGSLTISRPSAIAHPQSPRIAALVMSQHVRDLNTAVNTLETSITTKAPLASPTFTGEVIVPTPVNANDAATKAYVDSTAGSVPNATFSVAGKVRQREFNVRDYLAVGDGSTDDTTAFNNANTAATTKNGHIFIPNGTYILNASNISNITATMIGESVNGVILKLISGFNDSQNLIRIVNQANVTIENLTIDGNKANVSGGTQYGIYVSTSYNSGARNVITRNWTGVGTHYYNNTRGIGDMIASTGNGYHGFEFEQNSLGTFSNLHGYSNTLHGVLVSPGEVGGSGSHLNLFNNIVVDGNSQYGLAFNAANGDISAWLSEGDQFNNVSITNNSQYGLSIYKQDKQSFSNLYIANNGFFGAYIYQSANNRFNGITLHNNSTTGNGSYDEILSEGASSGHASAGSIWNNIKIIIDGTNKARYAVNEGSAGDINTYLEVSITGTPVTANTNLAVLSRYGHVDLTTDQLNIGGNKLFTSGFGAGFNSTTPSSAAIGIDAPFGSSSPGRLSTKYGAQLVTGNGAFDVYVNEGGTQNNVVSWHKDYVDQHGYQIRALAIGTSSDHAVNLGQMTSAISAAAPVDASPTAKGIVQLTNDLGGTATAPTTPTAVHLAGTETISGAKTFSTTITGSISGNSGSTTKLVTARTVATNLSSTTAASFDGTANITPGVSGTLPVANGGTGTTTSTGTGSNVLANSPSVSNLNIAAGTASLPPIQLAAGTLNTTTVSGAIEFDGTDLYYGNNTGTVNRQTIVATTRTQTLTNKTISGSSNTFSNIPESAVTNLTSDLASKLSNITGLVSAGTNVTITGSGTSASPYVISSSGSGGSATPGGSTTQLQFNNGGVFAGTQSLTYNATSGALTLAGTTDTVQETIKAFAGQANDVLQWQDSSGVPIWHVTSTGSFKNDYTFSSSTSTLRLVDLSPTVVVTGSANFYFFSGGTTLSSGTNHNGVVAPMKFDITKSGSGSTQDVHFVEANYNIAGTGATTNVYIVKGQIIKGNSGAITNAYGMYSEISNTNATNAITNLYHYYGKTPTATGTITNEYGLYLESMNTGTTNTYSIYTNSGAVRFGDSVSIVDGTQGAGKVFTSDANGKGSWQTAAASSSFTWNVITASQTASISNGYITNNTTLITLTLPATAAVGATIELTGIGTGGWILAQPAGVGVNFGNTSTTSGTGGSLSSTHYRDAIQLICVVANTTWQVISSIGDITVV